MNEERQSKLLRQALIEAINSEDQKTRLEEGLFEDLCRNYPEGLNCFSDPRRLDIKGPAAKTHTRKETDGEHYELTFQEELNPNYLYGGHFIIEFPKAEEATTEQLTQLVRNGDYSLHRYAS